MISRSKVRFVVIFLVKYGARVIIISIILPYGHFTQEPIAVTMKV